MPAARTALTHLSNFHHSVPDAWPSPPSRQNVVILTPTNFLFYSNLSYFNWLMNYKCLWQRKWKDATVPFQLECGTDRIHLKLTTAKTFLTATCGTVCDIIWSSSTGSSDPHPLITLTVLFYCFNKPSILVSCTTFHRAPASLKLRADQLHPGSRVRSHPPLQYCDTTTTPSSSVYTRTPRFLQNCCTLHAKRDAPTIVLRYCVVQA